MPYSPEIQRQLESSSDLTLQQKRHAVLESFFIRRLWPSLPGSHTFSGYPWQLLLTLEVMERLYGSQRNLLLEIGDKHVWEAIRQAAENASGDPSLRIPHVAPQAYVKDRFLKWIVENEDLMTAVNDLALETAVQTARACGHFPQDSEQQPQNLVNIDPRFLVQGDGTFIPPYSQVQEHVDLETGEITLSGSRAKDPKNARIQTINTNGSLDGKTNSGGINHVAISTYTPNGLVLLAATQAHGAEVHALRELLRRVHMALGTTPVWIVWDRVVTGRVVGELLADFGLVAVNKNVKDRKDDASLRGEAMNEGEARRLFQDDEPLPLGVSVYETTKGLQIVKSVHAKFKTYREDLCCHEIYEDDGALFVARSEPNRDPRTPVEPISDVLFRARDFRLVKVSSVRATHAKRERVTSTKNGTAARSWQLTTLWTFACPDISLLTHEFETTWTPGNSSNRVAGQGSDPFNRVRLIPRSDPRFAKIHGKRNIAESSHVSTKRTLGTSIKRGRAVRLDSRIQMLQYLSACILITSITEFRQRLNQNLYW